MKNLNRIILLFTLTLLISCKEERKVATDQSYFKTNETGLKTGGIKIIPIETPKRKFNIWTKFKMDEDISLQKFKEYYENMFKTEISMITYGTAILYSNLDFINCDIDITKNLSELFVGFTSP